MGRFTKLIKEENNKTALASHPLFNAEDITKVDYFQSLVFMCVEDDNFSDEEKEYIKVSLVAMGLDESLLEKMESFTQEPDNEELLALIERLKAFDNDLKFSFLLDACLVAFKDGNFDESEMELFKEYLEILNMSENKQIILNLANILNEKDMDGAIALYATQTEIFEKFKYMFELLGMDVKKKIKAENTALDKIELLEFNFIEPRFITGELFYKCKMILDEPVNNEQFCIFLNVMYQEESIKIDSEDNLVLKENDYLILSSENKEIQFTNNTFISVKGKEKNKITFITTTAANMFIDWIGKYHSCEYTLTHFDSVGKGAFSTRYVIDYGNSFIKHSINGEFCIDANTIYVLDENNTFKGDILLWSTGSDQENIEPDKNYYSSHTSFRFGKRR